MPPVMPLDVQWFIYTLVSNEVLTENDARQIYLSLGLRANMDNFVNVVFLSRPVVVSKMVVSKPGELILLEKDFTKRIERYEKKCLLNSFSSKSIEEATQKIYDYHLESSENFKKMENKNIVK